MLFKKRKDLNLKMATDNAALPFEPNESKNLEITTDYGTFARYPVKTHVIMDTDNMPDVLDRYLTGYL